MFGTIRRHQTWLWAIIITITIASFVIFGPTTTNKIGNALFGQSGDYGSINGQAITRDQFERASREIYIQTKGTTDSPQIRREIYLQLFYTHLQEQLGIQISTKAAATWARDYVLGGTSMEDFTDKVLKKEGVDATDFGRFVNHVLGHEQMSYVVGTSGRLVPPAEAEAIYRARNLEISASMVYLAATNYLTNVTVTPEILGQYYSNQLANYRVRDRVEVNYVEFDATNYQAAAKASATNLEAVGKEAYDVYVKYGTNLIPKAKTADEAKTIAQEAYLKEQALLEARKAANAFAEALDKAGGHAEEMEKLAKTNGLTLKTTQPFDEEGLENTNMPRTFAPAAFALTDESPFSGLVVGDDAVYILGLKRKIPSSIPTLESIKDKVTSDYKEAAALQIAQQSAAVQFHAQLTNALNPNNGITLGRTFEDICADAKLKAEPLPPFSLSSTNFPPDVEKRINPTTLAQVGFSTPPGTASQAVPTRDGAYILYVEKVTPVDDAKVAAELPKFTANLRLLRQNEAANQWYNFQANRLPDFIEILKKLESDQSGSAGSPPQQ